MPCSDHVAIENYLQANDIRKEKYKRICMCVCVYKRLIPASDEHHHFISKFKILLRIEMRCCGNWLNGRKFFLLPQK